MKIPASPAFAQTGRDYGFKATAEKPLLFQLEYDFSERINLALEQPEQVASLHATLADFRKKLVADGTFWGAPKAETTPTDE